MALVVTIFSLFSPQVIFITLHSILSKMPAKWQTTIWLLFIVILVSAAYQRICSCHRWNCFFSGWNCFLSGSTNLGWSFSSWSSVNGGNNFGWNMSGDKDWGKQGKGTVEEFELESEVTVTKDSKPLSSSFEIPEYDEGRK